MGRSLEVVTSKRVRAIRSRQYGRRQRVIRGIVDRIIRHKFESDNRGVVVTCGAVSFNCKGRHPGPVKALRREVEKRVGIGTGPSGAGGAVGGEYGEVPRGLHLQGVLQVPRGAHPDA